MRACLALAALLSLAGCVPALTEGRYTCLDDECPDGWFCHPDNVCRTAASRELEPCESDAECPGGVCDLGAYRGWATGYCTRACTSLDGGECAGLASAGFPVCNELVRHCVLGCDDDGTGCPEGLACVARGVRSSPTDSVYGECFPASAPIIPGEPCTGAGDCSDPDLECVEEWCTRACSTRAGAELPCPEGEVCRMDAARGEVCRPS